jgi:hypothetical protein
MRIELKRNQGFLGEIVFNGNLIDIPSSNGAESQTLK